MRWNKPPYLDVIGHPRSSRPERSASRCVRFGFWAMFWAPFIARYRRLYIAHVRKSFATANQSPDRRARKSPAAAPYVCVGIRAPSREASRAAVHARTLPLPPRPCREPSRLVVVAGAAAAYDLRCYSVA
jgi:hypothetical protein